MLEAGTERRCRQAGCAARTCEEEIMATTTLKITGMSCAHCVRAVKEALEQVDGVRSAEVDLGAGRAQVEYDETRVTPRQLVGAVMDEGYTAEETT